MAYLEGRGISSKASEKHFNPSPRESLQALAMYPGEITLGIRLPDGKLRELKFVHISKSSENKKDTEIKEKMRKKGLRPVDRNELSAIKMQILNNKPVGFNVVAYGYKAKRSVEQGGFDCTYVIDEASGEIDVIEDWAIEDWSAQGDELTWDEGLIFVFGVQQPNTETLRPAA